MNSSDKILYMAAVYKKGDKYVGVGVQMLERSEVGVGIEYENLDDLWKILEENSNRFIGFMYDSDNWGVLIRSRGGCVEMIRWVKDEGKFIVNVMSATECDDALWESIVESFRSVAEERNLPEYIERIDRWSEILYEGSGM